MVHWGYGTLGIFMLLKPYAFPLEANVLCYLLTDICTLFMEFFLQLTVSTMSGRMCGRVCCVVTQMLKILCFRRIVCVCV